MNDLAFHASVHFARGDDLLTISRRLVDIPMSALESNPDIVASVETPEHNQVSAVYGAGVRFSYFDQLARSSCTTTEPVW